MVNVVIMTHVGLIHGISLLFEAHQHKAAGIKIKGKFCTHTVHVFTTLLVSVTLK